MAETYRNVQCTHPGCREAAHFVYHSKREAREADAGRKPYLCVRHLNPDKLMSPTNTLRVTTMIAERTDIAAGLYWNGTSGFEFGPGFKAFAKDCPEGTTLTITAEIRLPELKHEREST